MAKVILYGNLAEQFQPEYQLDVYSPREAVRALCVLVPDFKKSFQDGSYFIYSGDLPIDEDNYNFVSKEDIHIVPEIIGAKKGLGKVLAGIALIGLTFVPGFQGFTISAASRLGLGAVATETAATLISTSITNMGLALALGGASMMLSPKPRTSSDIEKEKSGVLQGIPDGTLANGNCVPLVYGTYLAEALPVSFEVSDVIPNPVSGDTAYDSIVGDFHLTQIIARP